MKLNLKSIRTKLILSFLAIVFITGFLSIIISREIINRKIVGQAFSAVQANLNTAEYIYTNNIRVISLFINHLASLSYIKEAIVRNNRSLIINKLDEVRGELSLDILNITDARGRVIARSRNHGVFGDSVIEDNFIRKVLDTKRPVSGSDVMESEYLIREGQELAEQAYFKIIPTQRARKRDDLYEDRGMVIKAAAPIVLNGRTIGIIYGAKLLNNNFEFVDRIHSLVFRDDKVNGLDVGTATIFMGDLRISTNVKKMDHTRAVGTQVSEEVYKRVFEQGKLWLDIAFVVNNWYISAYSPIYGIDDSVIGILYVGLLKEKYDIIKRQTNIYFLIMTVVTAFITVIISIYIIRYLITPIHTLVDASRQLANGNYDKKIEINSKDEMGDLCFSFNMMVDAINERDRLLKESTEKQIVQSEKLASLGRLASGIAHEINNPLTGVLTYSSLLLEDLEGTDYQDDLQIVVNETLRCRRIVKGILDFARETKLEKEVVNINDIVISSLSLLERHVSFQNIRIIKNLSGSVPPIPLDINQMKSVINNLAVNAADAMSDGGTLVISTNYNHESRMVILEVSDTGSGIPEENLTRIFDPFFTTKETGKGTGLGLAVIYGIIKRHNGTIDIESEVGFGTSFIIGLPQDEKQVRDDGQQDKQ